VSTQEGTAQPVTGQRVLVTGGAGTIGSTLVDQLVEAGVAEIVVLDNLVRGRRENLAGAQSVAGDRLILVEGDVRDRGATPVLAECDPDTGLLDVDAQAAAQRSGAVA